jgi:glycine oxidase
MEVYATSDLFVQHTLYHHAIGCILPKSQGKIYIGATHEYAGFDKTVTAGGIATLLDTMQRLAPRLKETRFERAWGGLRPTSLDGFPLIEPSQNLQELWVACGHGQDGILLGPLTGRIVVEGIQNPYHLILICKPLILIALEVIGAILCTKADAMQ